MVQFTYNEEMSNDSSYVSVNLRSTTTSETTGAYHLTGNFGNSVWKVNGKVTFRKFQPKIEEYVLK